MLAQDVANILSKINIENRVYNIGGGGFADTQMKAVYIYKRDSVARFAEIIGFRHPKKYSNLNKYLQELNRAIPREDQS